MSKKWAEAWASVIALRPLLRAVLDLAVAAQSSQLNLRMERQVVGVMSGKGHGVEHASTGAAPPIGSAGARECGGRRVGGWRRTA